MLEVTERLEGPAATAATLTLPFEQRQKSRLRTRLDDGTEIALLLPTRGTILRDGDSLRAENGLVIQVRAASEAVSLARTADPWQLARASYHLGNRHVPLQIGEGWLRYLHDHVLDEMVRTLGLQVEFEQAPFEPEGGAYASHGAITTPGHRHAHG